MKKLVYILSLIFLGGCSGPLKSSWNDFRAYYNTHYNAKKSFRIGLKQIEKQPVTINPDQPVRPHREPNEAGKEYFAETIDKEAQLLRNFPDSEWADDALFFIGKSYYYRKEFYLALQKFEELYALDPDPELKQQSIIWKGRTLLDLGRYQDAIIYLENKLAVPDELWSSSLKAEAQVLLAEHYAMVANWESVATYLNSSLYIIKDKPFLGRTFFLYGQALEHLGQYGQAFKAYDQVSAYFPDYEYIYQANIKKGQMAREEGKTDLALSVFTSMKKDDKNFERQSELDFEIAKTLEVKGYADTAEQTYSRMLNSGMRPLARELQARVYYRLGEIYSEQYKDYEAAAAYYDSSSMQMANTDLISRDEDVEVLAKAYGRYASLRKEISRVDSLLWLGSLPASELVSVIEEVRRKKRYELQQEADNKENITQRMLANVNQTDFTLENESTSQYGFLNYRKQNMVADAKSKFRAVWGNRPLVDNWRRVEAVARMDSFAKGNRREARSSGQYQPGSADHHDMQLDIDLSEIPTTQEQRLVLARRKTEAQYELGSLFFLTLDLPDSAVSYFRRVVRDRPAGELEVKSMYSLFELYHLEGEEDSLALWGKRIMESYPNTIYSERVNQRLYKGTVAQADISNTNTGNTLLIKVQAIENVADSVSLPDRAEKFRQLALDNHTSKLAPHIHYRAIQDYIRLAQIYVEEDPNSVSVSSLLTGYRDSLRTMIEEHNTTFATAPHRRQLRELEKVLVKYERESENLKTCRESGLVPDMEGVLGHVEIPGAADNSDLPEEIVYRLIVGGSGGIITYQSESKSVFPDLVKAYDQALEKHFRFYPLEEAESMNEVHCTVSFPVRK